MQSGTFELTRKPDAKEADEKEVLKKQLQKERQKLDRIREAYENGIDTLQEYKVSKDKITQRISELEQKLAAQPKEADKKEFTERARSILEQLKDNTKTETEKNMLIRSIVDRIVFDRRKSQVQIFYYI